MITALSQIEDSYGTAIRGYETDDVAFLDQADSELAAGFDRLAQAFIGFMNEAAAVRGQSLNPLLYS